MSSSQASVYSQILPRRAFEQLCYLWQQMAEMLDRQEVIFLTEDIFAENAEANLPKERFRVLICQQFSALLSGKSLLKNSAYHVSLSFDPRTIADFLNKIGQPIQQNYNLNDRWQKIINLRSESENIPGKSIVKLLEIITNRDANVYSSYSSDLTYPRFSKTKPLQKMLSYRLEQERILNQVSFQIDRNLDLLVIVKMTIEQVQRLLQVDRLVIYQLNVKLALENENGQEQQIVDIVTYEAKASEEISSILNFRDEVCFSDYPQSRDKYRQGFSLVIDDVDNASDLAPCLRMLMKSIQVRAKIVTPIIVRRKLWGFVIAHQCLAPRQWKQSETKFLSQVAEYLAIAIYQADSYELLKKQKNLLQQQVNERVQQLQDALLAAQVAHKLKTEFIGNMSHELRTPLTCVIGLSGTLLHWSKETSSLPPDKQRQYLQVIHDSGKHLLELVNDILEISQVEAGKSLLNISEFSLRHLCSTVLHNFQEEAERKKIELEQDLLIDKISDRFHADRERVQHILLHLLDNAIKFTPEGGKVILRVWREQNQAIFQIEDTGIGIFEDQLPLLFEKFKQLEGSRQRIHGGAGLGLAITKQLVELHQGIIEVESIPEQGSLFTVRLPDGINFKPKKNLTSHNSDRYSSGGGTIVLLEKDEEIATLICELLTAANYQVVWLIDGFSAIGQISLLKPSAVIIDRHLPDVCEIGQTLKQSKSTKDIKLLLLSSQTISKQEWHYLNEHGIDDYLLKPLQPTDLLDKLSTLMFINNQNRGK